MRTLLRPVVSSTSTIMVLSNKPDPGSIAVLTPSLKNEYSTEITTSSLVLFSAPVISLCY